MVKIRFIICALLTAVICNIGFCMSVAAQEKITPIDIAKGLSEYDFAMIPIKGQPESEFSNLFVECIEFKSNYYSVGLAFSENTTEWNKVISRNKLPVEGYDELREKEAIGVCYADNSKNPLLLYKLSKNIIVLADYNCIFNSSGDLIHTAEAKNVKYRICKKIPNEKLYRNCWVEDEFRYYIDKRGKPVCKNTVIDNIRYKFNKYGQCEGKYTGWTKSSKGRRYWKDGILVTNRYLRTKSGVRYYADEDGYVRVV